MTHKIDAEPSFDFVGEVPEKSIYSINITQVHLGNTLWSNFKVITFAILLQQVLGVVYI